MLDTEAFREFKQGLAFFARRLRGEGAAAHAAGR